MRFFLLLTLLFFVAPFARAQNVVISQPLGAQIKIAIASSPDADSYVNDKRTVALAAGQNVVRFFGVPASLDDDSIQPTIAPVVADGNAVEVLQQRFRPIVNATEKGMLQRAVGQSVMVLRENQPPLKGTLLTTEEIVLLDTPEGIVVNPQGTFVVPRPDNLPGEREIFSVVPVLEWVLDAPAAGEYVIDARYAMKGLSWAASYRASLLQITGGENLNLTGWLSLKNESSLAFRGAEISLLNGGDLKLNQAIDLPRGEERQVSFLRVKDLAIKREAVFWPTRGGEFLKNAPYQTLQTMLRLKNTAENQLGVPLPAGALTVWGANKEGALQRLTQQRIAYTNANALLWIPLGESNIRGTRTIVATRQLNPVTQEHTIQISLSNAYQQETAVVIEDLPYGAKITEATIGDTAVKFTVLESTRVQFLLPVTNGGETILKYVVEVKS